MLDTISRKDEDYWAYQGRLNARRDRRAVEQSLELDLKEEREEKLAERKAKEAALKAKETERQAKEAALKAKEDALQKIKELEARLQQLEG